MLPELSEIRKRRNNLEINQKKLASQANVSQSFIAKVETDRLSPSYAKVKAVFETLDKLEGKVAGNQKCAKDIFNKKIVSVNIDDSMVDASKKMLKYDFSQLPVCKDGEFVGSISESAVNGYVAQGNDLYKLSHMKVSELMEDVFPRIDENYSMNRIATLLNYSPAILTTKKEKVVGIITKSDIMKNVQR
jgi:predicted transcriptional regulator